MMESIRYKIYQCVTRIFSKELIREAYLGVLGREPEEEALGVYGASFKELGTGGVIKELSGSTEAWENQKRAHVEELIREAYLGVLGREPEEEALGVYGASFKELGTGGVIKELTGSTEAWENQKRAHVEELIWEAYQGVLGREPDPGGVLSYLKVYENEGVPGVLEGLIQSTELWHRTTALSPEKLIRILYRGILLREADEGGLAGKAEKIRNQLPWEEIIAEMLRSPEFLTKHQSLLKSITTGPLDDLLEEIADYHGYHKQLHGTDPDHDAIAAFITSGKKVRELKQEHLSEKLKNPASMKVLLIGAYGNGNLGDAYQAVAVQQQMMERYSIPKENIYAASHNNVAGFPFAAERTLTREQLMDPDFVNTFGIVVIGGGGLLSHPHPPFVDKDQWIQSIQTPIIIHAVGAGRKTLQDCRTLIRKAVEISGRDEESITVLKEYREDCTHEIDPILASTSLEALEQYDEPLTTQEVGEKIDCLWILKYPLNEKDRKDLDHIRSMVAEENNRRHQIVAIEPERDRELENWFPGEVHYCTRLKELNQLIRRSEKVISMRYHGAIFGMLNKKRTLGFSQIKIKKILANGEYLEKLSLRN
jgi:polysaccharide pyruvyl transferase WcaK-like protein